MSIILPTFTKIEFTDLVSNGPAIINSNFSVITSASLTSAGLTQLATQTEVNNGTEAFKSVVPSTLNSFIRTVSSNIIASVPVSASQTEVNNGIINNKFVVPSTLYGYISTLSADQTEADAKVINNKFITPAVFNTVRNSEYIFSKNYTGLQTFSYTGSTQTFNLSADVGFYAIVCIGGGAGGYNSSPDVNINGGLTEVASLMDAYTSFAIISALGGTGGNGGAGSLGGNAGQKSAATGGTGMITYYNGVDWVSAVQNTYKTYQFSQYISVSSCLGGQTGTWNPTIPGYGGGGGNATIAGGAGGTSLTFAVYKNNTLFIDNSLASSTYRTSFIPKFYCYDNKFYITVGRGGVTQGTGNNGVAGKVIIYWWK